MDEQLEGLRGQAAALGVKVDGRWGVDRLRAEIEAAQHLPPADDQPKEHPGIGEPMQGTDSPADGVERDLVFGDVEPVHVESPPVHRAGGHIDRGDGRGWVIEE